MKRLFAFVLAVCLLVSLPVLAGADDTIECHNLGKTDECSDYSPTRHMVINRSGTIADYVEGADIVYDTKGNILTRTDEEGIVWEYIYSPYGSFMYRIGTIANPEWTIAEPRRFSNNFICSAAVFEVPYENCIGFDLAYEVTEIMFGDPSGYTAVYLSEPEVSGSRYQEEGRFVYVTDEEISYTVQLDEPATVAAVCLRPMHDGPIDYSACLGIFNVRIKSYDYM